MKLHILGFYAGTPHYGHGTSGYLLQCQDINILLDCGSGTLAKMSTIIPLAQIDVAVVSHLHFDHMADLGILQYYLKRQLRNQKLESPLPLLIPDKPAEIWQNYEHAVFKPHHLFDKFKYSIGSLTIEFMSVNHTIPCYAVKISDNKTTFVYSADTAFYAPLVDFAKGSDLFLCEATILEGSTHTSGKGHMDGYEAGKIAQEAGVKQLILTHLPNDGDHQMIVEAAMTHYKGSIQLASQIDSIEF